MRRKSKSSKSNKAEAPKVSGQTKATSRIDHAFVSSGEAPPAAKASWKRKVTYWVKQHKRQLLVAVGVLIVLVAALFVFWPDPEPDPPAVGCSKDLVRDAGRALAPSDVDRLQPIVQQMESSVGYEDDPNCVYVVMTYYINTSDSEKATQLYNQLVQAYDPDEGYDQSIAARAKSPEEVKPTIEFLQSIAEDFHGQFGGLADEED